MIAQSWRIRVAAMCLIAATACARNKNSDEEDLTPRPDPIPIHVRNENFLDMNVYYVGGGVQRRMGTVNGNTEADFSVAYQYTTSAGVYFIAIPIGGGGRFTSPTLNVGVGQMVVFRIAPLLRQSVAIVQEP